MGQKTRREHRMMMRAVKDQIDQQNALRILGHYLKKPKPLTQRRKTR